VAGWPCGGDKTPGSTASIIGRVVSQARRDRCSPSGGWTAFTTRGQSEDMIHILPMLLDLPCDTSSSYFVPLTCHLPYFIKWGPKRRGTKGEGANPVCAAVAGIRGSHSPPSVRLRPQSSAPLASNLFCNLKLHSPSPINLTVAGSAFIDPIASSDLTYDAEPRELLTRVKSPQLRPVCLIHACRQQPPSVGRVRAGASRSLA
jgi:hypothetical protein